MGGFRDARWPFWVKPFSCCMGGEVALRAQLLESPDLVSGEYILWGVFATGLASGLALVGVAWLCLRPRERQEGTRAPPALTRWKRIAERAVVFLRKRRAISLAFGNYRNKPLRRAAPTRRARRRIASPGTGSVLSEGPAIRHGSQ